MAPCILINQSGRVISFLGGYVEGKTVGNGFRCIPTHRTAVSDDHVERIKDDKIQSRVMWHLIKIGDLVDVNETFADLADVAIAPAPKMPEPAVARFDSTTSPEVTRAAVETKPAIEVEVAPVEEDATTLVPPAPVLAKPLDPATVADLPDDAAIRLANRQTDVAVLGQMWTLENGSPSRRPAVIAAIEARGHALQSAPK